MHFSIFVSELLKRCQAPKRWLRWIATFKTRNNTCFLWESNHSSSSAKLTCQECGTGSTPSFSHMMCCFYFSEGMRYTLDYNMQYKKYRRDAHVWQVWTYINRARTSKYDEQAPILVEVLASLSTDRWEDGCKENRKMADESMEDASDNSSYEPCTRFCARTEHTKDVRKENDYFCEDGYDFRGAAFHVESINRLC